MLATRLATRGTLGRGGRRARSARARTRVYAGRPVTRRKSTRVFFTRKAQQVASGARLREWLGAAATLAAIAGWGALLMLLGA